MPVNVGIVVGHGGLTLITLIGDVTVGLRPDSSLQPEGEIMHLTGKPGPSDIWPPG